jgi:hypothetical protein
VLIPPDAYVRKVKSLNIVANYRVKFIRNLLIIDFVGPTKVEEVWEKANFFNKNF